MLVKEVVAMARQENGMRGEVYLHNRLIYSGDLRDFGKYQNRTIHSSGFNDGNQSIQLYL